MKKKKRYIKTLAASLAAALMIPFGASAAPLIEEIDHGDVTIDASTDCMENGKCKGHRIQSTTTAGNSVMVKGGKHELIFEDGLSISSNTANKPPVFIEGGSVNVILEGTATLSSDYTAAIRVKDGASLTIAEEEKNKGKLTVTSQDGSGIGGDGLYDVGNITINSGTITAQGGKSGTGIGGYGTNKLGTVTINGGTVNATGGEGADSNAQGAAGIGSGVGGTSGKVVINGGMITAQNGKAAVNAASPGIKAKEILSDQPEGDAVIEAVLSPAAPKINGIVMKKTPKTDNPLQYDYDYQVYGRTRINENFKGTEGTMTVNEKATLIVPQQSPQWSFAGTIKGTGTIVDRENIAGNPTIETTLGNSRSLREGDVELKGNQQYSGLSFLTSGVNLSDVVSGNAVINVPNVNGVDLFGWTVEIEKENGDPVKEIKEVDTYVLKLKKGTQQISVKGTFAVTAKALQASDVKLNGRDDFKATYTGKAHEPKVTVQPQGSPAALVENTDYEIVQWDNNTNVTTETQPASVTVRGIGNYAGEVKKTFQIEAKSLDGITPKIMPNTGIIYDGTEKRPTSVEITVSNNKLEEKDYVLYYRDSKGVSDADTDNDGQPDGKPDLTSAGKVEVIVAGRGNYTGEAKGSYTIEQKELKVAAISAQNHKKYDGTASVPVEAVTLTGLLAADDGYVEVDLANLKATVTEKDLTPGVEFKEVRIANNSTLPLKGGALGDKSGNYKLPGGTFKLDNPIVFDKADPLPAPVIKQGEYDYTVNTDMETFRYQVKLSNQGEGARPGELVEYQYRMDSNDDEDWQKENVFGTKEAKIKILPNSTHRFEVYVPETATRKASPISAVYVKTFTKLPADEKPGKVTLTYTQNPDKITSTGTISVDKSTDASRVEYSFDGESYQSLEESATANVKKDCHAGQKYTAYVRYQEDATHQASDPVTAEKEVKKPLADDPVISLGTGNYTGAQEVEITSGELGAVIYYTTDGSVPGVGNEEQRYTGKFVLNRSAAIRAVAAMKDMEPSNEVRSDIKMFTEAPEIIPGGGNFIGPKTVEITANGNAAVYYTTDGSVPTVNSSLLYKAPFTINTEKPVIQAIAQKPGMEPSKLVTANFTMEQVQKPTLAPGAGTHVGVQTITMTSETPGVTFYYTTDGTTPTRNSLKYPKDGFELQNSATVKAIAVKPGMKDSEIAETAYTLRTEKPIVEEPAGTDFVAPQKVKLTCNTEGAAIYYTTDGKTVPDAKKGTPYTEPFAIESENMVLQAVAVKDGMEVSAILKKEFTMKKVALPTITPPEGSRKGVQEIQITSATKGAVIYYTTDGKDPVAGNEDQKYIEPFTIDQSTKVKAVAVKPGMRNSEVAVSRYTLVTEAPVFTPKSGTSLGEQKVTIASKTKGAKIYYTTDESEPSAKNGKEYKVPLKLDSSTIIKAVAVKDGMKDSEVAEASYTIQEMKTAAQPKMTPDGGEFDAAVDVALSTATEGADIYYTTDGSDPTNLSAQYTKPFTVKETTVVKAIAIKADMKNSKITEKKFNFSAVKPKITPNSGTLSGEQLVTITSATEGASIYYTTDGKNPTAKSARYNEPFVVDKSMTVKAIAVKSGVKDSEIAEANYTLLTTAPEITPNGGKFLGEVKVNIKCETEGADIYYTTDETKPTEKSPKYTAPLLLNSTTTVKAIAVKQGMSASKAVEAVFTVEEMKTAEQPKITPGGGNFSGAVEVALSTATPDADIYYTTDGSEPGKLSTKYAGPFKLHESATVKAITVKKDMKNSKVTEKNFVLTTEKPEISPKGGKFTAPQLVTISTKTANAVIYYTTDGSDPTRDSDLYSGPIALESSATVRAIAVKDGMNDSKIAEAVFEKDKVKKPEIKPAGGKFIESQLIELVPKTEGAALYYTTDGSDPTKESNRYTEPFVISTTQTIRVISVKEGMNDSEIAEAVFEKMAGTEIETEVKKEELKEVDKGLQDTEFNSISQIKAALTRSLAELLGDGYNHQNIAYYDVSLKMRIDGGKWIPATIENFPEDGLTVYLPYPKGVDRKNWQDYDFAVSHMFANTSERLGIKAGEIEEPAVEKTENGLKFVLRSTSPVAVGWKSADNQEPDQQNPNNQNPNNQNPNNQNPDQQNPDNQNPDNQNPDNQNPDAQNPDDQNPDNTDTKPGTTDNTNQADANADGTTGTDQAKDKGVLSSILPKTGDTASIALWVVLAVISIGAVITVIIKKRR